MKNGSESAVANYMRSIPKGVKHIRCTPVMRDGRCVATKIVYEIGGAQVAKEIPK